MKLPPLYPFPQPKPGYPYGATKMQEQLFLHHMRPEERPHNHPLDICLMIGGAGSGKSFLKGTPVLGFDGSILKIEDIKVGDLLMGPDSTPRKVLELGRGRETFYKVTPIKGDSFYCNESHILSLKLTNQGTETRVNKSGSLYIKPPRYGGQKIVNVSVKEYLTWSKRKQTAYKLYRSGLINFPNQSKPLPIDPYILGLWLGDGDSDSFQFTTIDGEIKQALFDFGDKAKKTVSAYVDNKSKTPIHRINVLEMIPTLKVLNLLNNKHIPKVYKTGSIETRLKLLAGLIDTDGNLSRGVIDFTQKNQSISEDIAFIARSLGLAAYVTKCKKSCLTSKGKFTGEYWRVCISGDLSIIPTRLLRKQAKSRQQKKDVLTTGFKLERLEEDDYYGVVLDKDKLFLLGDFTVVHNSACAIAAVTEVIAGFSNVRAVVGGKNFPLLKRNVIDEFAQRFSLNDGNEWNHPFVKSYLKQDALLRLQNGSELKFLNLDKYEVARGFTADLVMIEELNLMKGGSFDEMLRRSRGRNLDLRQFILTMNPTGERDWVYYKFALEQFAPGYEGPPIQIGDLCKCQYCFSCLDRNLGQFEWIGGEKTEWSWEGGVCPNPYCHSISVFGKPQHKENKCPGNQSYYRVIQSASFDNPHLPSDFVQNMKDIYSEQDYKVFVLGQIVQLREGKIYKSFSNDNVSTDVSFNPFKDIYWTHDFNQDPMCSSLFHITDSGVEVFDEIVLWNSNEEQVAKEFVSRYLGFKGTVYIYGDPAGLYGAAKRETKRTSFKILYDYLKDHGFNVEIGTTKIEGATKISIRDRINNVNAILKNAKGEIRTQIHPKCAALINSLASVNWDKFGKEEDKKIDEVAKESFKKGSITPIMTHPSCAFGYAISKLFPIIKLSPPVQVIETEKESIREIESEITHTLKEAPQTKTEELIKEHEQSLVPKPLLQSIGAFFDRSILEERLEKEKKEREAHDRLLYEKLKTQQNQGSLGD